MSNSKRAMGFDDDNGMPSRDDALELLLSSGIVERTTDGYRISPKAYAMDEHNHWIIEAAFTYGYLDVSEIEPANVEDDIPILTSHGTNALAWYDLISAARNE